MKKIIIGLLLVTICLPITAVLADKSSANQALIQARTLIKIAQRNEAEVLAPMALKAAQKNIINAKIQFDDREWTKAEIAGKKAQRDAELADAKAEALKMEKATEDLRTAVATLRTELNHQTGEY